MNTAIAKKTVADADWIIDFVDKKLSEVSYLQVKDGYVEVPLDFDNAVAVLTSAVCHLVIKHFQGDYSDVSIIFEDGVRVLKMKSPLYD